MVSQLLFGETCEIIDERNDWLQICCDHDSYTGWCKANSLIVLEDNEYQSLLDKSSSILPEPILYASDVDSQNHMILTAGCKLYNFNPQNKMFELLSRKFCFQEAMNMVKYATLGEKVTEAACKLLNVPYLWGGRSTSGIDCSGLVQTCYRIAGVSLPRDAYQQATIGYTVSSLNRARKGDIAFFKNSEEKIIHTGILLSSTKIIHASNYVRINTLDNTGILDEKNRYTHYLAIIKRILSK
jgi:hypothetical protein